MQIALPYGASEIALTVPDDALVYATEFPEPSATAAELVYDALSQPIGSPQVDDLLGRRDRGEVVVVVSDITRPVPYPEFLGVLLQEIEAAGVPNDEVTILVATGMHRPSTPDERRRMLGPAADCYRVVDHRADDDKGLVTLPEKSWAGSRVRLNRRYLDAGFRIVTGLVEPHFMAGFSGGRKAVCPGLVALETIRQFHGAEFLGNSLACNARLSGNPCHEEALSVARMAPPEFALNVAVNGDRKVVRAFAGDIELAHQRACEFVRDNACPRVTREADVVVTPCGGLPLDATFYQCVKGMVSCLPTVRKGGTIISFGSCSEGIGSPQYAELMAEYAGRWRDFMDDIAKPGFFVRDQWELQMQARALEHVGQENLHFITDGLSAAELATLSVNAHAAEPGQVAETVAALLQEAQDERGALAVAVIPEGPYCAPV